MKRERSTLSVNMIGNNETREREKIAKEIEKTSESIRKKHRALKTGRIEENIAAKRHFEPLIEPLQKIVDNSGVRVIKEEPRVDDVGIETSFIQKDVIKNKRKRKDSSVDHALSESNKWMRYMSNDAMNLPSPSVQHTSNDAMNIPSPSVQRTSNDAIDPSAITSTPRTVAVQSTIEAPKPLNKALETVFESADDSFATTIRNRLQTSEGLETLSQHLGPLGQKYIGDFLSGRGEKEKIMDTVYGVRLDKDGMMLGNKTFDVNSSDHIIIGDVKYVGTHGLYELIFKRYPNDSVYTENDKRKYKDILLATNAHKRNYVTHGRLLANKGYKYKYIIAPLLKYDFTSGMGLPRAMTPNDDAIGKELPRAMTLNDNMIDYVHWDDPNELVDRLRLLEASHRAGHNAHDNEMLSIIEELREAGLIIN